MITIFSLDQFQYEYDKSKYGDQAKLLFTDTDSFCYHIQMEDVHKDMQEDQVNLNQWEVRLSMGPIFYQWETRLSDLV